MVAFLIPFLPIIQTIVGWGIGATLTYGIAKKGIEAFGSTPNNRAADAGISNREAFEYTQKTKQEKLDYIKEKNEEKNKELKEANDKLKEDIKKLEQRLLTETESWRNETNESEKTKKLAIMEATQKELNSAKSQLKANEETMKKHDAQITKLYDELSKGGEKLTEEQLKSKNNTPDLGKVINWGIIAVAVIVSILIVNFIFGFFKKVKKSTGIEG